MFYWDHELSRLHPSFVFNLWLDELNVLVKEKWHCPSKHACLLYSCTHLDIYSGLNSNLNRHHHRLESRYSSSSGGSYEDEKSEQEIFSSPYSPLHFFYTTHYHAC